MTLQQKREALYDYCEHTACSKCKLNTGDWKTPLLRGKKRLPHLPKCLCVTTSEEADIDRALFLIGAIHND